MKDKKMDKRCKWAKDDLMIEYHDREWGLPLHDDRALFEFLILEGAQAGLSWSTILKRRKGYQIAFNNFDASKVSAYGDKEIENLMQNTQIIRNRLKINSTISGAKSPENVVPSAIVQYAVAEGLDRIAS